MVGSVIEEMVIVLRWIEEFGGGLRWGVGWFCDFVVVVGGVQ